MRGRLLLASITLGATVLAGGTAVAQAAPAHSQTGTASTTSASGPVTAQYYLPIAWYPTFSLCQNAAYANPGPAGHPSYCTPNSGGYNLMYWH